MPDFDVTLVAPSGINHTIRMEHYTREMAIVAGMNALFDEWAPTAEDFPKDALQFWRENKDNSAFQPWDLQNMLAGQWGIDIFIKEIKDDQPPPKPKPVPKVRPEDVIDQDLSEVVLADPIKFLAGVYESCRQRRDQVDNEIRAKETLRDRLDDQIMKLANMIAAAAPPRSENNGRVDGPRNRRAGRTGDGGREAVGTQQQVRKTRKRTRRGIKGEPDASDAVGLEPGDGSRPD